MIALLLLPAAYLLGYPLEYVVMKTVDGFWRVGTWLSEQNVKMDADPDYVPWRKR